MDSASVIYREDGDALNVTIDERLSFTSPLPSDKVSQKGGFIAFSGTSLYGVKGQISHDY